MTDMNTTTDGSAGIPGRASVVLAIILGAIALACIAGITVLAALDVAVPEVLGGALIASMTGAGALFVTPPSLRR